MKQKITFFLCIVFLFSTQAWGQTWNLTPTMTAVLDGNGTLTISTTKTEGEAMPDYLLFTESPSRVAPWYQNRSSIKSIMIGDKVTSIGNYAFGALNSGESCSSVTSVTTTSVITIGERAFMYCTGLTSITMSNSITTIGSMSFYNCLSLTSVAMPNSLTTIGTSAFFGCTHLTSIMIPNSVTTIGYSAFANSGLTSVTIPNSVDSIEMHAFFGCPSLKDVTVNWRIPFTPCPNFSDGMNDNFIQNLTLYVPFETKSRYEVADGWKDFGTIVEQAPNYTLSVSPTSLSFATTGEQKTFSVTSTTDWTVSSSDSWLTVSPASGSDNGTITVTTVANTATTKRTATITVSGTGVTTQTISVTQDAVPAILSVSPTLLSFTPSGEQKTFAVTSNTEWAVSSNASWLTVSPVSGSNNGTVMVTTSANTATSQRTATLTVSGTGITAQTINITQDGIPVIPVTSVVLNYSAADLTAGETLQLTATVFPNNATNPKVSWNSDNQSVATVSASGLITAKTAGTATVTATTEDGNKTATCAVTVKDISVDVPDDNQPVGGDGKGTFSLNLTIPSDATLTGSFEIQFPEGMTPDLALTVLASELAGNFNLSFTFKGNNTWLVTIAANGLRGSTATQYRKIIDIAYTVADNVPKGNYNASIKNLDFLLDNGTPIKKDLITVPISVERSGTAIENVDKTRFYAYFINKMLMIESAQAETITIYSVTGVQFYSTKKEAGTIELPFSSISGSVYIIKGSKSGTIKVTGKR